MQAVGYLAFGSAVAMFGESPIHLIWVESVLANAYAALYQRVLRHRQEQFADWSRIQEAGAEVVACVVPLMGQGEIEKLIIVREINR